MTPATIDFEFQTLTNRVVLDGFCPVGTRLSVGPSGLEFLEFTRLFQHFFKILNFETLRDNRREVCDFYRDLDVFVQSGSRDQPVFIADDESKKLALVGIWDFLLSIGPLDWVLALAAARANHQSAV